MTPRFNRQSAGPWVAQAYDAMDAFSDHAYDWKNLPLPYAARFGNAFHGAFPIFQQVNDGTFGATDGPVYGLFCWPGVNGDGAHAGREQAQWSWVFPVRIYSTDGGVFAIPQKTGDVSGWADDTTLAPQQVYTSDGSVPDVDTFGLVVAGTSLAGQYLLFFQGGGGGAMFAAALTVALGAGDYTFGEVDPATNGAIMGGRTGTATELNRSTAIPVTPPSYVWVQKVAARYYFFYPLAAC